MTTKEKLLEPVSEKVDVQIPSGFSPKEYFKNRDGLYVYSNFSERILEKMEDIKDGKESSVKSYKLIKSASDEAIEEALGENHIFSETEACSVIAALIGEQPKGEEGTLLNNGYANLFYTPSFVVSVHWDGGGWSVDAWLRDGSRWFDDGRVFSPATGRSDTKTQALETSGALTLISEIEQRLSRLKTMLTT